MIGGKEEDNQNGKKEIREEILKQKRMNRKDCTLLPQYLIIPVFVNNFSRPFLYTMISSAALPLSLYLIVSSFLPSSLHSSIPLSILPSILPSFHPPSLPSSLLLPHFLLSSLFLFSLTHSLPSFLPPFLPSSLFLSSLPSFLSPLPPFLSSLPSILPLSFRPLSFLLSSFFFCLFQVRSNCSGMLN